MDIQTPGWMATRPLRKSLVNSILHQHIRTDHSHDSQCDDRRSPKSIETGLNDYVSKPINVSQLANILFCWLGSQTVPLVGDFAVGSAPTSQPTNELDVTYALERLGGNQVLNQRLLSMFCQGHADDVRELHKALQNNDLELAHRLAHALRGVAGAIGAEN